MGILNLWSEKSCNICEEIPKYVGSSADKTCSFLMFVRETSAQFPPRSNEIQSDFYFSRHRVSHNPPVFLGQAEGCNLTNRMMC